MFFCVPVNLNTDPRLLDDPVRFPELLLDTTEIALAMASTADSLSANVFLSDRSASETHRTSFKSSQAGFGKTSNIGCVAQPSELPHLSSSKTST